MNLNELRFVFILGRESQAEVLALQIDTHLGITKIFWQKFGEMQRKFLE